MTTITLREAATQWCDHRLKLAHLSLVAESTWQNQTQIANTICTYLGDHALDAIRKSHIEIYTGERLATCQPVTVRGEMNVMRQILNWCVDEQLMVDKPRFPRVSVPNVESDLPSDEAFLWVLANVGPPHGAALEFMMLTGLSPHELERVQRKDGTGTGPISIMIGMRDDFPVKTPSRRRLVPLNSRSYSIWLELSTGMKPETHVFPRSDATQKAIRRACNLDPTCPVWSRDRPDGTADVTPKMMRKWFASKVSDDQPEHVLQRLLGHAPGSSITRRHYVRTGADQCIAAVDGLTTC